MEARPIVELSRFLKKPVVPVLTALFVAAPLNFVHGQAADNKTLQASYTQGLDAYKKGDYKTAAEQFGLIFTTQKDATPESVLYILGFSYYNLADYDNVSKVFRQYVAKFPADPKAPEVQLYLGKALLQLEGDTNAEEALKFIQAAATKSPELLEEARFAAADAYVKKKDTKKAAETLEGAIKDKISGPMLMKVALQLIDLYIEAGELEDATKMLRRVEESASYADVIVAVNHRLVQLGDKYLEGQDYANALGAYSSARPRAQVLALQNARLESMKSQQTNLIANLAARQKANQAVPHSWEEKAAVLKAMIDSVEKTVAQVKELDQYDAILEYRIARCYFNQGRFWPATAAFEAVVSDFPTFGDASTALYGAAIAQWRLDRKDSTVEIIGRYLDKFPDGKYVGQLSEINGVTLMQQGKWPEAVKFLTDYLQKHPQTEKPERYRALLANAKFADSQFDSAAEDYDKLRNDFPSSESLEEYSYRRALCDFMRNKYEDTIKSFENYEKAFPTGQFHADVTYRRGIIQLARAAQATETDRKKALYNDLVSKQEGILNDQNAKPLLGAIYTLLGDAYSAMGTALGDKEATAKAATNYAEAVKHADGDQVIIAYALNEATSMLRGAREWDQLTDLWQKFLKDNPRHPMELRGVGELSKLLVRSGKMEEARKLLVQHIMTDVDNPRSEYVEMLISQLANLYVPKRVVVKKGEQPPPPPAVTPEEEMLKSLELPQDQQTPAYLARVLFAKSELARMLKDPEKRKLNLRIISGTAKPEDLSPVLLSIVGQFLFDSGSYDEAIPFFVRLRDAFGSSVYADSAPVGLGRIALAKKDYPGAIGFFDAALNSPNGGMMKEATFGKAQALFNQKKYADAKPLFEEIVSTKDWRGEEKAGALYYLGEIADANADTGDANGYFQKVYLSQGGYPEYVAKAYIRSSDMFQKKGDMDAYRDTLRKMLANKKLVDLPEAKEAHKRLGE